MYSSLRPAALRSRWISGALKNGRHPAVMDFPQFVNASSNSSLSATDGTLGSEGSYSFHVATDLWIGRFTLEQSIVCQSTDYADRSHC
jgi:hypothetical protein